MKPNKPTKGMRKAIKKIQNNRLASTALDLKRMGIVTTPPSMLKDMACEHKWIEDSVYCSECGKSRTTMTPTKGKAKKMEVRWLIAYLFLMLCSTLTWIVAAWTVAKIRCPK